jgi:hypothetical protein
MKPSLFKYLVDHDPSLITVSFDSDQYHGRLLNLLATTRTTWPLLEHILTKHKERAAEAVTLTGPDGKTPLYTAIENRQSMIAAACLETFPELARVPDATGTTPLQAAFALVERQSDPQQHLNGLLDLVAYMRILLEQAPETIPLSGVDHSMLDAALDALRRHSVDHPSLIESSRAFEVLDDFEAKCGSANERGDDAPARSCIITDSEGITAMSPFPGPLIPATLRHRHARRQPLRFSR